MYEALVAHLRECAKLDPSNNTYTEAADVIEKLQLYADLYKDLTEKGEKVARGVIDKYPKWIPVEERLPDKSGYYLIVTHLGLTDDAEDWMKDNAVDVTMAHYADYSNIWTTDSGAAYNADLSKCDKTRYEYVTHWMPLPEPPKEE